MGKATSVTDVPAEEVPTLPATVPAAQALPEAIDPRALSREGHLSFADLMARVPVVPEKTGPDVVNKDEKARLIGVPMIIVGCRFNEGDNGIFASVEVVTEDNEHLVINDGSTGIAAQMTELCEKYDPDNTGLLPPIVIEKGLRVSRYFYNPDRDAPEPRISKKPKEGWKAAATFYLDL